MALETIYKLQPGRTIQLRGFDRRGAAATYYAATDTSWKMAGVFRDMADFAVLVLCDMDNTYEPLPLRVKPEAVTVLPLPTLALAKLPLPWTSVTFPLSAGSTPDRLPVVRVAVCVPS